MTSHNKCPPRSFLSTSVTAGKKLKREAHGERAAMARIAYQIHGTLMRFGRQFYDREAQAAAAIRARARIAHAIEAIEYPAHTLRGNPDPCVRNCQLRGC